MSKINATSESLMPGFIKLRQTRKNQGPTKERDNNHCHVNSYYNHDSDRSETMKMNLVQPILPSSTNFMHKDMTHFAEIVQRVGMRLLY